MVGRTILHYQLIEKLGSGGMGEIYKAQDTRLNRFVAIKVLPAALSADPERRRRFTQEAQAASALNHPNIITIYDIVSDGETECIVMEFVAGQTLLELIPKEGLRAANVLQYATQMADALSAAHSAGIIHRDLKPANVMITGSGRVKVLDFGLAKLVDRAPIEDSAVTATLLRAPLTMEGTIIGTVNYMSPEQAEGRVIDARSDIFSFGTVLYEMLTGRSAFEGTSTLSTLSAVLRDEVRPIVQFTPDVPPELEQVVLRCLKKDPGQRYQSMKDLLADLTSLHRQTELNALSGQQPSAVIPAAPAPGHGLKLLAVAVVVLLVAGGFGYHYWSAHRSQPAPPASPTQQLPAADAGASRPSPVTGLESQTPSQPPAADKPATPAPSPAATAIPPPARSTSEPPPVSAPVLLTVGDGLPVRITLAADIPGTASEGDALQFKLADDIRVNDTVIVRRGAEVTGEIVDGAKKRILGIGGRMTFKLDKVDAVNGQKIAIRATPSRRSDGTSKRNVEIGSRKSKEVAAAAGTEYVGYIDGAQTVSVAR